MYSNNCQICVISYPITSVWTWIGLTKVRAYFLPNLKTRNNIKKLETIDDSYIIL
jgi:hypothetical protein